MPTLTESENTIFDELSRVTSRFSPFEEDLKIPNAFTNEQEVKSKAIQSSYQLR